MEEIKEDLALVPTRDLFVELSKRCQNSFVYAYVENYDYAGNTEENKIKLHLSWFCPSAETLGLLKYLEIVIKNYLSQRVDITIGPVGPKF